LAFVAAGASAQAPADQGGGTRLVVVTVERRVGPHFADHPEQYGDSLQQWRGEVLRQLFGPGPGGTGALLRAGDHVALFADGAPRGFTETTGLTRDDGVERVGEVLGTMLALPGSAKPPPTFWLYRYEGSPADARQRVDEALRSRITCPLTDAPVPCEGEAGRRPGAATRAFSRPLLTLPVQYRIAARALDDALPDSLYWIWVQVGGRVNETNGLAAEIVRDFGNPGAAEAVGNFNEKAVAALSYRRLRHVGGGKEVGGVTVWRVTSARLEQLMNPAVTLPLAVEESRAGQWMALDTALDATTSFYRRMRRWMEPGPLRLALVAPGDREAATLLRVGARAVCEVNGGMRDTVPLHFTIEPGGRTAVLTPGARERLTAAADRCLPDQGWISRVRREFSGRTDSARLGLVVQAQVGPHVEPGDLPAPPVLSTLVLTRGWRHDPLELLEAGVLLLLLGALAVILILGVRAWRAPTRIDLEVLTAGEPVTAGGVVTLSPGAPDAARLRLRARRGAGRQRGGRLEVVVSGLGLQAEVPVVPGADATRVVEVHAANGGSAPPRLAVPLNGSETDVGDVLLYVPDDVADVDRIAPGVPLRAGIELTVQGTCSNPAVQVPSRTFYVPCAVRLEEVPVRQPPRILLRPYQRYIYRGLRLDPARVLEDRPVWLGVARVLHRAEPGVLARPYPVRLELSVRAAVEWPDGRPPRAIRAGLSLPGGGAPGATVAFRLSEAQCDLSLHLWPDSALLGEESARVKVSVEGSWQELRSDTVCSVGKLVPAREEVALYPAVVIDGVALDFGTSATRLAYLPDGRPPENVMGVGLPDRLIPPRSGDRVRWVPELESEVAIDEEGEVKVAGAGAHLEDEGEPEGRGHVRVLPSLKLALLSSPRSQPIWKAVQQVIDELAEVIEAPRRGGGEDLTLLRFAGGAWRTQRLRVGPSFRYLLLVTVPDAFTREQQEQLVACFRRWHGRVDILPLREAEAVVYGFLRRNEGRRPERTLVVDVGAGTVDFAAVSAEFHQGQMLEVRVEGMAVSRAAGNAYDQAIDRSTGGDGTLSRRLRETKERLYTDPEATGDELSPEAVRFLAGPFAAGHFEEAIRTPVGALLGRLALQKGWQPPRFDQVILSGRGSLAAGWKGTLVEELRSRGLVPEGPEASWLYWLGPAPAGASGERLSYRAGRLKAAVAEGALALITYDQTRVQTSRDILRDHLVLVGQDGPASFVSRLLLPAGEPIPGEGLTVMAPVGDWIDARLVFSSHPPLDGPGTSQSGSVAASASAIWRLSARPDGDAELGRDGGGNEETTLPVARPAGEPIRIQDRPEGTSRIRVSVARGGAVRWTWIGDIGDAEHEEART
jgi:hypothetical protein